MRKGSRIALQIGFIVQIQYSMAFKGWYKPRKGQQWEYTPVQSWLVDSMISLNYFQFFNQLFLILMILLTLASHVLVLACQGGCDPQEGDGAELAEAYDPDNKDDIFAGLESRINECKYRYGDLKTKFAKKKRQTCPVMCAICFEDFSDEQDVIQLDCNPVHVYHEVCLFEWFTKSKSCPMCRQKDRHALPRTIVE